MCLLCHSQMSNEEVYKQLLESKWHPNFKNWNSTSLSHTMFAAMGVNGDEPRKLALGILTQYITWYQKNKPNCYLPSSGMTNMPTCVQIEDALSWFQSEDFVKDIPRVQTTFPDLPDDISKKLLTFFEEKDIANSVFQHFEPDQPLA
jgi:hypothetical protein